MVTDGTRVLAEASQLRPPPARWFGQVCATGGPIPGWRHENVRPAPLGGWLVLLVRKTAAAGAAALLQDSQLQNHTNSGGQRGEAQG